MSKFAPQVLLLFMILMLLTVTSCEKKVIQSEPPRSGAYGENGGASSQGGSGADKNADAEALERQRLIEEERLMEEKLREEQLLEQQKEAVKREREVFENEDIMFEYDSAVLSEKARSLLVKKAEWLEKYPSVSVTIEGHTDERGNTEYNLALGDRRAESVKDFLKALGIPPQRMQTVSYGEERPISSGHDEYSWEQNRRAHFVLH